MTETSFTAGQAVICTVISRHGKKDHEGVVVDPAAKDRFGRGRITVKVDDDTVYSVWPKNVRAA